MCFAHAPCMHFIHAPCMRFTHAWCLTHTPCMPLPHPHACTPRPALHDAPCMHTPLPPCAPQRVLQERAHHRRRLAPALEQLGRCSDTQQDEAQVAQLEVLLRTSSPTCLNSASGTHQDDDLQLIEALAETTGRIPHLAPGKELTGIEE